MWRSSLPLVATTPSRHRWIPLQSPARLAAVDDGSHGRQRPDEVLRQFRRRGTIGRTADFRPLHMSSHQESVVHEQGLRIGVEDDGFVLARLDRGPEGVEVHGNAEHSGVFIVHREDDGLLVPRRPERDLVFFSFDQHGTVRLHRRRPADQLPQSTERSGQLIS